MKRKILYTVIVLLIVFLCLQFIRPEIKNPPVTSDIQAPANVKNILRRACYDCHSNETNLRWYDKIVPVYWQVASHVKEGRKALTFSTWNVSAPSAQKQNPLEPLTPV